MKRIFWTILVIAVLLVGGCGFNAALPASAAEPAPSLDQPAAAQPISALPGWVWLIILPSLGVFFLLSVTPLIGTGSLEEPQGDL